MKYKWPLFLMITLASLYWVSLHANLYLNWTGSLPKGIYRKVTAAPAVGKLATSCLKPEVVRYGLMRHYLVNGNCPGTGIQPVMKKIIAVPGDKIEIKAGYLVVNSIVHPELPVFRVDSQGRELKKFYQPPYRVSQDNYVLVSDYVKNSWDSRYWGEVKIEDVVERVW